MKEIYLSEVEYKALFAEKNESIKELASALKECSETLNEVDGVNDDTEEFMSLANKYLNSTPAIKNEEK